MASATTEEKKEKVVFVCEKWPMQSITMVPMRYPNEHERGVRPKRRVIQFQKHAALYREERRMSSTGPYIETFTAGCYITDDPEEIKFLRNFNEYKSGIIRETKDLDVNQPFASVNDVVLSRGAIGSKPMPVAAFEPPAHAERQTESGVTIPKRNK